jgi:hypothetical protein
MIKISTYEEVAFEIGNLASSEEKLMHAIEFMRGAISSEGNPRFRDFWRMKKVCFELFASEANPIKRASFWKEYAELLKEAHRLQEIFKEEIEFHTEQIKLAITGLENEVLNSDKASAIQIPQFDQVMDLKKLEQKARFFEGLKEKVIRLREEVLGLEIRIHQKNELLEMLKKVGDAVFPEYKKTIGELTALFVSKADELIESHRFGKKEIRQYQALLKEIHISHEAYRNLREKFSHAWKLTEEPEVPSQPKEVEQVVDKRASILKEHQRLALSEVKTFIEKLRKELTYCGLDFELARFISGLIEENKKRLS